MAAVLCRSICDVIKGICDAAKAICNGLGQVLCLPCRLCGMVTAELGDIVCSPFFLYLSAAYGLNLPPIVFAIRAKQEGGDECERLLNWLLVNAILCAVNMAAAAYIVSRIQADETYIRQQQQQQQLEEGTWYKSMHSSVTTTRSNSYARIRKVLCEDPGVAAYILVGIFYIAWTSMGVSRLRDDDCGNYQISEHVRNSVLCNFLFLWLGGLAFCCSISC